MKSVPLMPELDGATFASEFVRQLATRRGSRHGTAIYSPEE